MRIIFSVPPYWGVSVVGVGVEVEDVVAEGVCEDDGVEVAGEDVGGVVVVVAPPHPASTKILINKTSKVKINLFIFPSEFRNYPRFFLITVR